MQCLQKQTVMMTSLSKGIKGRKMELLAIGLWLIVLALALILQLIKGKAGLLTSTCCFSVIILNVLLVSHMIINGGF